MEIAEAAVVVTGGTRRYVDMTRDGGVRRAAAFELRRIRQLMIRPLIGCAGAVVLGSMLWRGSARAEVYSREDIIVNPTPAHFSVCHAGGCTLVTQVSLGTEQWRRIAEIFSVPASDPALEREKIADAIAAMETIVGELTGTSDDRPENQLGLHITGQMDCIDESTNTSIYLRMLVGAGLLKWHRVEDRVTRGWFIFGWPHTTAVARDTQSGEQWAIDSWFFANGERPAIVPLSLWRNS